MHSLLPAGAGFSSIELKVSFLAPLQEGGRISTFTREHREMILISAWLQVTGAILYVGFILAIVHLAGAGQRFAGRLVAIAAAILVGLTLLDSAMIISAVQSATHGHNATLRVSYDVIVGPGNNAIGRSFLIAPAILLPLGFVILQSRLLPRSYGWTALGFGTVSQCLEAATYRRGMG